MSRGRWLPAEEGIERYRPAAVVKLEEALEQLHQAAYPAVSGTISPAGRISGHSPHDPLDGAHWRERKTLRSILASIERLAEEARATAEGRPQERHGWACAHCGRWQRPKAKACDQCGTHRSDLPPEPPKPEPTKEPKPDASADYTPKAPRRSAPVPNPHLQAGCGGREGRSE